MRDYYEALDELLTRSHNVAEIVQLPFEAAIGHILAEDLTVQYDAPRFDNSAMDGYALADINAKSWTIVGQIAAGDDATQITLKSGEAVRIFTGAGVPEGTDAVAIQEDATVTDKTLTITGTLKPAENIRKRGEELSKGNTLIAAHTIISPAALGMIASQGYATVTCYRPLKVTVFATGDELTQPGVPLKPNHIYDSNRPMLLQLLSRHAFLEVVNGGVLPDNEALIKDKMQTAATQSDVVICSGGASVGDKDYVKQVLTELGELEHWKLAIKPGKPFAWGHIGQCKVYLLPGNPVASFVTLKLMTLPSMKCVAGMLPEKARPTTWKAQAGFSIVNNTMKRRDFMRGYIETKENGMWVVPVKGQGSHMLSSCMADVLVEVPAQTPITEGQWVNIYPLNYMD